MLALPHQLARRMRTDHDDRGKRPVIAAPHEQRNVIVDSDDRLAWLEIWKWKSPA